MNQERVRTVGSSNDLDVEIGGDYLLESGSRDVVVVGGDGRGFVCAWDAV